MAIVRNVGYKDKRWKGCAKPARTVLRLARGHVPFVRCLRSSLLIAVRQEPGAGARGCAGCPALGDQTETQPLYQKKNK